MSDVDLNTGRIQIRDAKDTRKKRIKADGTPVKRRNRAGRVVYADRETLAALREWWDAQTQTVAHTDHFFISHEGHRLEPTQVRRFCSHMPGGQA